MTGDSPSRTFHGLAFVRAALRKSARRPLAGLLLAALAAGASVELSRGTVEATEYATAPAARGTIDVRIEAKGVVQPRNTIRVTAPDVGTVTWMGADVGTRVRRGQPLARIVAPERSPSVDVARLGAPTSMALERPAARDVDRAPSDVSAARAALEQAHVRRDAAVKQAERLEAIPDLVPRLQIEAARRQADAEARAFEAAEARFRMAETAATTASRPTTAVTRRTTTVGEPGKATPAQAETVVTSPIDGVVVSRQVAVNQILSAAQRSRTMFTIGANDSTAQILVEITEADAGRVYPGLEVVASVPGQSFLARLSRVGGTAGSTSRPGAVSAIAEIATPSAVLRPGTRVDVDMPVGRKEGVLKVPADALSFTPEPADDRAQDSPEPVVWVMSADGALVRRSVETGLSDGESTEIVAGAVREGDLVITGELGGPRGGDLIQEPPSAGAANETGTAAPPFSDWSFVRTTEVETSLRYYASGAGRMTTERAVGRSSGLRGRAEEIFREEGVPTELVWLALVESGWRDTAVSPVGAAGIWQFMPATAERFGLRVDDAVDERYDFEKATRAAATYLHVLAERYDGNWELAVGAYNCGEGAMDGAIERVGGVEDFWTLARDGALPDETARYVPAVLAASLIGRDLGAFGLGDPTDRG